MHSKCPSEDQGGNAAVATCDTTRANAQTTLDDLATGAAILGPGLDFRSLKMAAGSMRGRFGKYVLFIK